MKTVKRLIGGRMVDVKVYNEMEWMEHEVKLKYDTEERRNREHADRVAATLAKDQNFIDNLAHQIVTEMESQGIVEGITRRILDQEVE